MLDVTVETKLENDQIDVSWEWKGEGCAPTGYLIKWADREEQLAADKRKYQLPIEDQTALVVTLQTMGESSVEYNSFVNIRGPKLDKAKEEAMTLIMRRKAELLRDIARVRRDLEENAREVAFFTDPERFKERSEQNKHRELKTAVRKFNQKPKKGLEQFILHNYVDDSPKSITKFLLNQKGLSKSAIGELLGEPDQKYLDILEQFVVAIDFKGLDLVEALRRYLSKFKLPGEAQKIDRIIETFSKGFMSCNPTDFSSSDTCYVIAFSIILLNTSLHNPNVKEKPTEDRFIRMCAGIDGGNDLPSSQLGSYFKSINKNPFKLPEEEDQAFANVLYNPDKEGFLYKLGGKIKGWKRRWIVLTEKTLYYFEEAKDREPKGIIPLNNVQVRKCDEKGRNFCFELYKEQEIPMMTIKDVKINPDGKVIDGNLGTKSPIIRFSAPTEDDLDDWVSTIKKCLGRDPMYDLIADRRRRAGSIRQPSQPKSTDIPSTK